MKLTRTTEFLKNKIIELKLPYFSCIIKKDGQIIFDYCHEENDKGNDLLLMYSMSKPITAIALMQLVEKGLVNLDDKVSKYLPNFENLNNITTNQKIFRDVKIWNLLSMTSGLDYDFSRKSVQDLLKKNSLANTVEICSCLAKDGLLFNPGERFQYSLSMDVIAAIIEVVTKKQFSLYVKENIFDKLGMNKSSFKQDLNLVNKCRKEYCPSNDLSNLIPKDYLYKNFFPSKNYESGGAGLISTINDYSLFADSLANRENIIIKDDTVNDLAKIWISETPFNESVKEYSKSSKDYGYGLGVRVRKSNSIEGIPQGEFGWDGAAGCYFLVDRKNHISIVMGLTISSWPLYLNDFHIALVKNIYTDIFKK